MAKKKTPPQRHNDALLTAPVRKALELQYAAGLKSGAYAVCKVVHDKATAEGKTVEERLEEIVRFVSVWSKAETADKCSAPVQEEHHEV